MAMKTAVYRGRSVTVLAVRSHHGGEVIALVCEDEEECRIYKRLFQEEPPHRLDDRTPLGRRLKKHHPSVVLEVLAPPTHGDGWPWIVAFYSPNPVPDGQRGHWAFESAGDRDEARTIALDIQRDIERHAKRLKLGD
ncbi:hypothetical protein [Azospirillum sp.]|uniref:hypothetical protein n=1 Tax=Azospirillum sp. TaxID=34012 RepID=UPI003D75F06C